MLKIRLDRVEAEERVSDAMRDPTTNLNAHSTSGHGALFDMRGHRLF